MMTRITALLALLASVALVAPLPAQAQKFEPGSVYICPNQSATGLDCYLDAVVHLYTMCRHVKSIEIIEFGYEKSEEGFNGAKSEYCTVKPRINIIRPYQAALREATISTQAVEGIRSLQEAFLASLDKLKWVEGETDEVYKKRGAGPYDDFKDRIDGIKKIVAVVQEKTNTAPAPAPAPKKAGRAAKDKP